MNLTAWGKAWRGIVWALVVAAMSWPAAKIAGADSALWWLPIVVYLALGIVSAVRLGATPYIWLTRAQAARIVWQAGLAELGAVGIALLVGATAHRVSQVATEVESFQDVATMSDAAMSDCFAASNINCAEAVNAELRAAAVSLSYARTHPVIGQLLESSSARVEDLRQRILGRQLLENREIEFRERQTALATQQRAIAAHQIAQALVHEESREFFEAATAAQLAAVALRRVPVGAHSNADVEALLAAEDVVTRNVARAGREIRRRATALGASTAEWVVDSARNIRSDYAAAAAVQEFQRRCPHEPVFNFRGGNNGLDRLLRQLPGYREGNQTRDCTAFIRFREPEFCWQVRCVVDDPVVGASSVVFAFDVNQAGAADAFRIIEAL